MKTQIKRFSKSALAVVLTLCMLVSCMTVGIIATDAAQSVDESVGDNKVTFYIYPSDLWSDYASYTIKANANIGDNNTWRQYDFTDTGRTIGGKAVYTVTIYEKYGGVDVLQIQKYDGSTWKEQKQPYSSWTTSSTFSGKIYNGSTWTDLPAYDSLVPNITGINGDWSTGNTMTLDSGNNYYYEFTGGGDKYFRFKYNNKYYEAYNGDFNLVNGNGGPYDGSTSAKKYGTRENNNNAFKLPSESGYKYRIYFDTDGKKTWFTKTIISTTFSGVKAAVSPSGAATVSPSSVQNVKSDVGTNVSYSDVDARYSFSKWTASNGTFGSVGGSTETTTASPKFYPTANNATATANFNQKSGKLTLINDTSKGTVAGNATSVTSVQSVTTKNIPAVTVKTGYIFNGWTVTSGTVYGKSGSSTTAYTSGDYIANGAAVNLRDNATITANYTEATYNSLTAVGKYSTNGTSFTSDMPTQPTIAPTSGTYQTGVKVTAPDVDGYQFVTWYTDNGTFGNAADKETMFKPSTNGAQAVARYKKIFTITSSVDSTGTGAGTVSISITSGSVDNATDKILAGGSYEITATPKNGSAIESIKVNNDTGTTTSPRTVNTVSADQTVVVKFKSNVYLKGTMNSTAWAGDVMTANTAGTSYTIANVVLNAGTVYKFKHFVDSGSGVWNNTAPATWTLNGIATHGTKDDGYGSTNLTITPSVKAKVTFVSDGTKFTSITAIPYDSTTYNVTVYAKDGAIRADTFGSTYANIADTKIYLNDDVVGTDHSGNITNQTYQTYKAAKGDTIVIKTTIGATDSSNLSNADALKAKYYVRGFCVNGEVSELLEPNDTGVYTLTYKVPEDYEGKNIEITPIYYLKDTEANPIVTYRVTGFTDALKAVGSGKPGWGDTLYTYPFYGKLGGQNNAFGAYPGQPMVYYEGQYQMQIPQKSTAWDIYYNDGALSEYSGNPAKANAVANTTVSGVTMSNGYYDIVHRQVMGYGDNSSSADHVQTYDYGDFYKIFNEKKPVDNIVFDFKYRTTTHNLVTNAPSSPTPNNLTSTYKNGFELLTNFHGRNVDLFGDPLSGDAADPSKTKPLYVVSIGGVKDNVSGVENIAGYYATEWKVFAPNLTTGTPASSDAYKLVSNGNKNSIPPEVLVLNNNSTSFNNTTYPSAVNTTAKPYKITDWKALYTALEAYRGKPVYISYEAADAQQAQGKYYTGTGGATRNDGRWLYSKNGENITSKIKIQYSNDNGKNYNDLNTTNPQVKGLSAYFTNDGVEGQMTYSTTIDPDKTFDFEAKTTNADYKFVGWFMEDGTKITTDNSSYTERSGSYTFVAKFMQVQGGQLILSHSADKGTISGTDYQGAGTAKISAVVKNGDEVVRTYDLSTSDITLDDKIIKSDSTYTIEVTLEATATGQDTLGTTVLANPSGQVSTYFNPASTTTEGKTKTIVLNSFTVKSLFSETTQSVKNIIYHSYFNQVKFHYQVTFQYKDRFGETKNYTRQGYLTTAQVANENYVDTSSSTKKLLPAFIQTIAPHVSNFGETITWNFDTSGYAFAVSGNDYNVTATISATQTSTEKRNITFKLPYEHNDGIAVLNGNVGTAAATTKDFALTGDRAVDYKAVPVLPNSGVNGIYTNDKFKNWIAAPAVINDNGTQKYFQYWSIASTSAEDREIERCYFNAFNYAALDNFVVTPKYGTEKTDISQSGIYTGVTYLETSRNQWNDNQKRAKTERGKAADLLYNDFVINFNYKGAQLNLDGTDSAAVKDLGVVVERIQELDIKQDGTKDTDISKYTGIAKDENTVKNIINESITDKRYSKHSIAKKDLDNKNSYMLYDAFYNGAGWNLENQKSAQSYTYKNYVYRVYTYIKYTDENGKAQIVLSEVPGYFTMYDEAVKDYVAPKTSSTNP